MHSLAHDLRGPVERVRSFCELLRDGEPLEPEHRAAMMHSANAAHELLEGLRTLYGFAGSAAVG